MNCQECDSGTPRYLDEHTGVWLHAVTIEGVAGGFVVCKDPCRVDTGTPKSCALGTEGCGIAHQLGTTVELSTTIDARKADR